MDTAQLVDTFVSGFINKRLTKPASTPAPAPAEKSLAKGLLAGLAAGIIATAAKTVAEKIYPPRPHAAPADGIHWGFGMTAGAAYGVLAEFYPAATSREGVNFGMTLLALTHETALPALAAPVKTETTREKTSEIASHIIFGLVTETVRRTVRKRL
jgi:putative membrane protein